MGITYLKHVFNNTPADITELQSKYDKISLKVDSVSDRVSVNEKDLTGLKKVKDKGVE